MTKRRSSTIWLMPADQFKAIVAQSTTLTQVLSHFSMRNVGSNNLTLKRRIKEERLDISHFRRKGGGRKGPRGKTLEQCMAEVFVAGKDGGKNSVRFYLRRFKLIEEKCALCPITTEWNGKPLTLQLDHISGDSTDDRLENLRWICPNCHSQTDTYTGKANKGRSGAKILSVQKFSLEPRQYESVVMLETGETQRVIKTRMTQDEINAKRRADWPSKEELRVKVWEKPLTHVSADYGFDSLTSLKRIIKFYGIDVPPVGYWPRLKAGWTKEEALRPRPPANKPPHRRFTDVQVSEIRIRLAKGDRPATIARDLDCSHKTIRDIRDGLNYRQTQQVQVLDV